jgi:hypothetical protein
VNAAPVPVSRLQKYATGSISFGMDLPRFQLQIPDMGKSDFDSRCSHCGSPLSRDRNRPGRFECARCDRLDPLKSEKAMGWLQSELQPPK